MAYGTGHPRRPRGNQDLGPAGPRSVRQLRPAIPVRSLRVRRKRGQPALATTGPVRAVEAVVQLRHQWHQLGVRVILRIRPSQGAVIGAFEKRLPAYAYSRAEWTELREGEDWRRYVPLTRPAWNSGCHRSSWPPIRWGAWRRRRRRGGTG
ncbi:RipA family octameric membrane protein [Streptomyces europaeiscabiei]|uniref:RipA family octameric membrane protein n=1 Tax=Streptomyces europaeiscabiei TaxID=146819 RepID=UPI003CC7F1BB